MCFEYLYPYIKFALGTLYPAYKTWKALKRKDETTRRRWMKYWVSYAAFQTVEQLGDIILIYLVPFYYLVKLLVISWLVYGARVVYDSIINRELTKREKTIDKQLTRIFKLRNELIATLWCELSQCSVRIIAALMSGGLSVLTKSHPEFAESALALTYGATGGAASGGGNLSLMSIKSNDHNDNSISTSDQNNRHCLAPVSYKTARVTAATATRKYIDHERTLDSYGGDCDDGDVTMEYSQETT